MNGWMDLCLPFGWRRRYGNQVHYWEGRLATSTHTAENIEIGLALNKCDDFSFLKIIFRSCDLFLVSGFRFWMCILFLCSTWYLVAFLDLGKLFFGIMEVADFRSHRIIEG